ncbi:L-glutamate gamma-semialdehyde dehydrogenase [Myxococcota bacterium]|nr:L-glutamate gamma-semialdehyde dehydrogenase [Myxococcota bacterium]
MVNSLIAVPEAYNEPILSFAPGSPERAELKATLKKMSAEVRELPLVINGKEVRTDKILDVKSPHNHSHIIGKLYQGGKDEILAAIDAAEAAREDWANMPFADRAAIFLRAADLLTGPHRQTLNAATMLGQSKTAMQAEIDVVCELADFWRFNVEFALEVMADQPLSVDGQWNQVDYRPLDGFVLAVSPFNFSSIAGNLPTAPALMGNTVVWKSATTSALSSQYIMDILLEAGLPDGVINLVHAPGRVIGEHVLKDPRLAGIHFTGSTNTFQHMWKTVGENIANYKQYPRLVGETGGKDFIFAHSSADAEQVAVAIVRGAFEYQGQKCSAASRAYIPANLWDDVTKRVEKEVKAIKMGDTANFENFMGAIIDQSAFDSIKGFIDVAKKGDGAKVWLGGGCDDSKGYFIEPTVVIAEDPHHLLMEEEIFGPVMTMYKYDADKFEETLEICDKTSPYALTGAIFANDRKAVLMASDKLRFAAGNFYINDKPTGAVVGQQPFGGGRASGTNDKAGSKLNLIRWTSTRTIKESFNPSREVGYPYMDKED